MGRSAKADLGGAAHQRGITFSDAIPKAGQSDDPDVRPQCGRPGYAVEAGAAWQRSRYRGRVAAFDRDSVLTHPLDYRLAAGGFVNLYWSTDVLQSAVAWLRGHGYRVIELDASAWHAERDMHSDLASALDFPDYYGHNLNALNDCLGDVAVGDYGLSLEDAGLALVVRRIDLFAQRQPVIAHHLIEALAGTGRGAALFGHRILCLAQSDDPDLAIPAIGASPVQWNDAEWLASKRHPGS